MGSNFRDVDTSSLLGKLQALSGGCPLTRSLLGHTVTLNGTQDFLRMKGTPSEVKVVSKDPDAVPPTITVDGGDWLTASEKIFSDNTFKNPDESGMMTLRQVLKMVDSTSKIQKLFLMVPPT